MTRSEIKAWIEGALATGNLTVDAVSAEGLFGDFEHDHLDTWPADDDEVEALADLFVEVAVELGFVSVEGGE